LALTNQPKQAEDTSENLNDENLDEQVWVCGVSKGGGRAGNSDANTTEQVACTDGDSTPEDGET
jgi:hypothetical protein